MSGVKHDMGKAPMDLLDSYALEQLAHVLGHGATKYSKHNWRHGLEYSRLVAATLRHVTAFNRGRTWILNQVYLTRPTLCAA
jgi:hypothetical protein